MSSDNDTELNRIIENLARQRLSGNEWQIIMCLLRKTYGWSKTSDTISLGQLSDGTGISRPHVARALARLVQRNIVIKGVARIGNTTVSKLSLNKRCGTWQGLPKAATLLPEQATPEPTQQHENCMTGDTTITVPPLGVLPEQATGVLPEQATTIKDTRIEEQEKEKPTWSDDPEPQVPYQDILDLWRSVCVPVGMHNLRDIAPMQKKMQAAWHRMDGTHDPELTPLSTLERFRVLFARAAKCEFLAGRNDRKWAADLEFVLRPLSVERIMAGYYDHGVVTTGVHMNPSPVTAFSAGGLNDRIRVEPENDTTKEW